MMCYIPVLLTAFCLQWYLVMLSNPTHVLLYLAVLSLSQREEVGQEVSTNFVGFRLNFRSLLASLQCQGLRFVQLL
jgi:hypothetical protein